MLEVEANVLRNQEREELDVLKLSVEKACVEWSD